VKPPRRQQLAAKITNIRNGPTVKSSAPTCASVNDDGERTRHGLAAALGPQRDGDGVFLAPQREQRLDPLPVFTRPLHQRPGTLSTFPRGSFQPVCHVLLVGPALRCRELPRLGERQL